MHERPHVALQITRCKFYGLAVPEAARAAMRFSSSTNFSKNQQKPCKTRNCRIRRLIVERSSAPCSIAVAAAGKPAARLVADMAYRGCRPHPELIEDALAGVARTEWNGRIYVC